MAGTHTPYKKIADCYSDEEDVTLSEDSPSEEEDNNTELVPRPDPVTWFNSIQRNIYTTPPTSLNTTTSAVQSVSSVIKRRSAPFNVDYIIPPSKKRKVEKKERKLTITQERSGELASVRISVPPGVELITLSVVKRGLSRFTTHAMAEDRVDVIPLAPSRDLNKFNGIAPSEGIIRKSLKLIFYYTYIYLFNTS